MGHKTNWYKPSSTKPEPTQDTYAHDGPHWLHPSFPSHQRLESASPQMCSGMVYHQPWAQIPSQSEPIQHMESAVWIGGLGFEVMPLKVVSLAECIGQTSLAFLFATKIVSSKSIQNPSGSGCKLLFWFHFKRPPTRVSRETLLVLQRPDDTSLCLLAKASQDHSPGHLGSCAKLGTGAQGGGFFLRGVSEKKAWATKVGWSQGPSPENLVGHCICLPLKTPCALGKFSSFTDI